MNKVKYSNTQVHALVHELIRQMIKADWKPDYIVGITRGGLTPAVQLSQYLDVPLETLKVRLQNGEDCESNLWMAEDAFQGKNILIVDDINDSGATLKWIKEDWQSGCLPNDEKWKDVWNNNVKFAVLISNEASEFKDVDFAGEYINKRENPSWIVFPWEQWWA